MVPDEVVAEHRRLLAASMAVEAERRAAAARNPGVGMLLNTAKVSYYQGVPWQRPQVGLGFGEGHRPEPHVAPVPEHADPLVSGVPGLAAVVVPGSRPPAVSQLVTTTSAAVAHNRAGQVAYIGPSEPARGGGLLGRFLEWLRGGRA